MIENFEHSRHGRCRRITVEPKRKIVVGCDLGKSVDSTVVAVLEYQLSGTGEFRVRESSFNQGLTITEEIYRESYDLRNLKRLRLELNYYEIIDALVNVMNGAALIEADLVIDDSGVGRPIGDLLEAQTALRPIRVTSTGGEVAHKISQRRFHVPKKELVSNLSGIFATNRIRIAHDLPNLEVLRRETQAFLRRQTASGRDTFGATGSEHDDTISALALACWYVSLKHSPSWLRRRGGEFSTGYAEGMVA